MKNAIQRFYEFLDKPIWPLGRVLLALLCIPLGLSLVAPLWHYEMEAPQYRDGLYFDIYANRLVGGNNGQHIQEINTLNHYIGMRPLDAESIPDLGFMPFVLGILILLTLRVAAIGTVRTLVDHTVLTLYTLGFFGARFVYQLYSYGHDLSPDAPVDVAPFTPVIIGTDKIANFTVHSMPRAGAYYLGIFGLGVVAVAAWHLIEGRMRAAREDREREARGEPVHV